MIESNITYTITEIDYQNLVQENKNLKEMISNYEETIANYEETIANYEEAISNYRETISNYKQQLEYLNHEEDDLWDFPEEKSPSTHYFGDSKSKYSDKGEDK